MALISGFYADWQTIAFAAAGISVFVSAMLIILSRAFALRNLEQTAKIEFVYAASTVFIVLMTIGLLVTGEFLLVKVTRCIYLTSFGVPCDCPVDIPATTLIDYMKLYIETPVTCAQQALDFIYVLRFAAMAGRSRIPSHLVGMFRAPLRG